MHRDFEPDLLHTFVAIAETGGFARAGERVHRSQSAVSLQMKRLEAQAGTNLFQRDGRRMTLTEEGHCLLRYAERILALHDEARTSLNAAGVGGNVRFGTIQDLADGVLPQVLGRFARALPDTRLEVRVDNTAALVEALDAGALDLAIAVGDGGHDGKLLRREPSVWIGSATMDGLHKEPLPLILCNAPCGFREMAIWALDQARIRSRVVLTSPSFAGVKAAVRAGLGITVRGVSALDDGLIVLGDGDGLPDLPDFVIMLHRARGADAPAVDKLADLLIETVADAASISSRSRN